MSKKFINSEADVVDDFLNGLVASSTQVSLYPKCRRVVVRSDVQKHSELGRVSLIAGGGSGHEPYACGYVGNGLLTAAVAGNVFASPPSRHVQAALEASKSSGGALLFVINYTGDRLNFGLAAERFQSENNKVKVVMIGDDVAIDNPNNRVGRRGLAGAVLTIKIAGAMSEEGKSFDEIYEFSQKVGQNIGTLGVSLYPGSLPGKGLETNLGSDEIEVGLGIHGEPGKHRAAYRHARDIVADLMNTLKTKMEIRTGERIIVLVNNLGGVSQIEMNIVAGEVVDWCKSRNVQIVRFFVGAYMTSLDGHGISVTILRAFDDAIEKYLDAPSKAPGWIPALPVNQYLGKNIGNEEKQEKDPLQIEVSGVTGDTSITRECIQELCAEMKRAENELNRLDGAVGDGDCGSTFAGAAKGILSAFDKLSFSHPQTLLQQISKIFEETVGGTSGAIYALMLSSAATSFSSSYSSETFVDALARANESVQKYGGARPGDRTMVDALNAAFESLKSTTNEQCYRKRWTKAVEASEKAAVATAHQRAAVGRASYTSESQQTLPDAGATAVGLWLRAVWTTVDAKHDKKE